MKWYPKKSIIKLFAFLGISKKRHSLIPVLNHSGQSYFSLGAVLSGTWLAVSVGVSPPGQFCPAPGSDQVGAAAGVRPRSFMLVMPPAGLSPGCVWASRPSQRAEALEGGWLWR